MNLTTLILQIILTIPLTIIINYIQYKEEKRINLILVPTIYIILISALFPSLKHNIFLIVVFEIFIRNFYVTSIVNQKNQVSNSVFIIESILSIILSLFTYNYFISNVNTVIPNPEEIKPFLWFLIIIYLTKLYTDLTKNSIKIRKTKEVKLKQEQIIMQYAKFKNTYSTQINTKNKTISDLLYALMIYKDNKNPKIYRSISEFFNSLIHKNSPHGIMQIESNTHISDLDSILLKKAELEKYIKGNSTKELDQINKALANEENKEEIIAIYNIISEFNKK